MSDGPQDGEESSIWHRLRRRKVVQWGLAYAAGAWGLLQGLQFLAEAFDWPSRVLQLGTVAALIGLPIVLVLAWYHGDRGQQRVSRIELTIVTLLFLIGGGLFWRYQHTTGSPTVAAIPAGSEAAPKAHSVADSGPSIAVLPFDNRSAKEDDAFFVDGIHDDILTQLSKISALKVISRTSVEQFRDTKLPIKEIARQLGVKTVLEGGVQRGGERVRINVQLIDAGSDAHLWAETYDRELTAENIFAIQSELATAIAGALKTALSPAEKARVAAMPTQSLEAWEAYQRGRQRMAKRTSAGLAEAEEFFRQSIGLDPRFALAHTGLGDTLRLQTDYSGKPMQATLAEADKAISRALELDANLAEARASKGGLAMSRGQFAEAERLLRHAVELNPNYAQAHQWLSLVLRGTSHGEEQLAHAERAVQLDPLSAVVRMNLCDSLDWARRYDEAAACHERTIAIDPTSAISYYSLALLDAYTRNRLADAVVLQERAVALDTGSPILQAWLAAIFLDIGNTPRAKQLAASLVEQWPEELYSNAAAAVTEQLHGSTAAAERHASKVLAEFPQDEFSLRILRDVDLRQGDARAARARYVRAFPELVEQTDPRLDEVNYNAAVDLALILQKSGEPEQAARLLEASERVLGRRPRLGLAGYRITDAQIYALRGEGAKALRALRNAEQAGWRGPIWRYYRDIDPALDSIRNEPEFKAVFDDIERDMARQRAELAKRAKDAPRDRDTAG